MLVVLSCLEQLRDAAGHQHRLHVALGLREVEELAAVGVAAHLDEPPLLVVADVRERAGGNIDVRVALPRGGLGHPVGQLLDPLHRLRVA